MIKNTVVRALQFASSSGKCWVKSVNFLGKKAQEGPFDIFDHSDCHTDVVRGTLQWNRPKLTNSKTIRPGGFRSLTGTLKLLGINCNRKNDLFVCVHYVVRVQSP